MKFRIFISQASFLAGRIRHQYSCPPINSSSPSWETRRNSQAAVYCHPERSEGSHWVEHL